jgi:methylase of polypeptide subunit release factors
MPLADTQALLSLPPNVWSTVGQRLHEIGFSAEAFAPIASVASLTPALAKWHLRRSPEPAAHAMRMLAYEDAVTEAEARAVLGEIPLERMLEIGLLARTDQGIVSPFVLQPMRDLYVLGDDLRNGGEAVMGLAPSTRSLAAAASPQRRVARALDVGCGAGALALAMALRADHVVATDISERAIALMRVNAMLNGLANIDARVGDLFEPVAGETFDVIVSQPPFIPRDDDDAPTTFLFGGPRGDELCLRLLAGLVAHLAPGAMAFLLVEWPIVEGDEPLDERIAEALGPAPLSLLHVQPEDVSLDEHCARYAIVGHPRADEAYERAAVRRREHFAKTHIVALRPRLTVARRNTSRTGWRSLVEHGGGAMPRARIDAMFAARDLVTSGREALLASKLRLAASETEEAAEVLRIVHESSSVGEAVTRFAAAVGRAPADVTDEVIESVQEALIVEQLTVAGP